jgi:hypothetical protein
MPNTNSKIIVASPILGALIGTMTASTPAVVATSTTVFSYSVSGIVASGFGLLIGTVIGAAFGVGVALIGLGMKGMLYESDDHPNRMTGIRILGGLSTNLGVAGIGALIGSLIFPGIGTIIGGLIGLFFGVGVSAITTVFQNQILEGRKTNLSPDEFDRAAGDSSSTRKLCDGLGPFEANGAALESSALESSEEPSNVNSKQVPDPVPVPDPEPSTLTPC